MSKFRKILAASLAASFVASPVLAEKYGLGRQATDSEVAAWNIDVRPDGQGLPAGRGTVEEGEVIWSERCSYCHGHFGQGLDRWPVVAGGQDSLSSEDPVKTVGSYWPYLSTVFDYINRAMPFTDARSLEPDEVYALTAYILYINDVVEDEAFELSKANFADIKLPNENNFVDDDRLSSPVFAKSEPCMKDCKPDVKVTGRARILDVTPDTEDDN